MFGACFTANESAENNDGGDDDDDGDDDANADDHRKDYARFE